MTFNGPVEHQHQVQRTLPVSGVVVPLITPLTPDREADGPSMVSLVDFVVEACVTGVLVLGSSGENGALSASCREAAVQHAVRGARGRIHVMVGVAALGTSEAIDYARRYQSLGADSLLVPPPFVFTPSDREMRGHFEAIAAVARVPVVAYDVPSRTHAPLSPTMLAQLGSDGVIAGVKDSSNDLAKPRTLVELTRGLNSFVRYTGVEEAVDALLLTGYDAAVPGLANVFPRPFVSVTTAAARGEWEKASAAQSEAIRLLDLYQCPVPGGSPAARFFAGAKEALRQMGVIAHNTSSVPFLQPDEAVTRYVSELLRRAAAAA